MDIKLREKELTTVPGYENQVVVIKKYSYGDKSRLQGRSINTNISKEDLEKEDGDMNMEGTLDLASYRIYSLIYGIKSAPFFKPGMTEQEKLAVIDNDLTEDAGAFIYEEITKFNQSKLNVDLKKN